MVGGSDIGPLGSKYELTRHIARGGMSDVYAARVTGIEGFAKTVAIKRIRPELAVNREMIELFLKEARLAGRLHHPNIAQVYDLGFVDGTYFLAMEFVEGADVRWILRRSAEQRREIPLDIVVAIGLGVCAGLHYLHEEGPVLHRDISPSNVMVGADGAVKLIDFGIALARWQPGVRRGKPSYMSPEQCLGRPLDRRTDVYSTAVLLWELSVLEKLFAGRDEAEILWRVLNEAPMPPNALVPDYPLELQEILLRALSKMPSRRQPSAEVLQDELERFARARRLDTSASALSRYLSDVLGDREGSA